MAGIRALTVCLLAFIMLACPDPKPPSGEAAVTDDNDSVYGRNSGGTGPNDTEVTDLLVEEEPIAFEADRLEIDSESLETINNRAFDSDWEPIYFEFDKANLTPEAKITLKGYATILRKNRQAKVLLEGHCDIRGTEEYNMALGERRAQHVKKYLMELGIDSGQLKTISYGELRPQVIEENERAWTINRRVAFTF